MILEWASDFLELKIIPRLYDRCSFSKLRSSGFQAFLACKAFQACKCDVTSDFGAGYSAAAGT